MFGRAKYSKDTAELKSQHGIKMCIIDTVENQINQSNIRSANVFISVSSSFSCTIESRITRIFSHSALSLPPLSLSRALSIFELTKKYSIRMNHANGCFYCFTLIVYAFYMWDEFMILPLIVLHYSVQCSPDRSANFYSAVFVFRIIRNSI